MIEGRQRGDALLGEFLLADPHMLLDYKICQTDLRGSKLSILFDLLDLPLLVLVPLAQLVCLAIR